MNENEIDDGIIALQTVMSLNEDGLLRDLDGNFITIDDIYKRYWKGVNKRTLFNTLVKNVMRKHEIVKEEDERKKNIFHLLLEQPDIDFEGKEAKYLLKSEAGKKLQEILLEQGKNNSVVPVGEENYEPGWLCTYNDTNYYVIEKHRERMTMEEFRQQQLANPVYVDGSQE